MRFTSLSHYLSEGFLLECFQDMKKEIYDVYPIILGRVIAISRGNRQIACNGIVWRVAGRFVVFYTGIGMWLDNRGYFIPKRFSAQGSPGFVSVIRRGLRLLSLLIRASMFAIL